MNKRKSVAFVAAHLDGNFNAIIWREIYLAAQKADCNLLVFEGRALGDPRADVRQHCFIYGLLAQAKFDGFILGSSQLCRHVRYEEFIRFCEPFFADTTPVVSFGLELPGAYSLVSDNRYGLRALMEHLIVGHGFRRLAFIKGPENNIEANERFDVYCDALSRHGIPFDADLVAPGDFSSTEGYNGYRHFERKGVVFDAIVCANDETATGAYRYINEQRDAGREIPDVPITGYDNTIVAQLNDPAITTVAQPYALMAEKAFARICGPASHPAQELERLPTELVIRNSCGCEAPGRRSASNQLQLLTTPNYRVHQTMMTFSLDELYDEIDKLLVFCGIRSCFIVLYPKPVVNDFQPEFPSTAQLIYANKNGRTERFGSPVPFDTADLLPADQWGDERVTRIFKPLFFRDEQMGYVIIEPMGIDTKNFDAVRGQIGNMLKIIHLLMHQGEIEERLARAVGELQEFNRTLNILSVRDELTGLLNRRGFFSAVQREFDALGDLLREYLVVFADIDGMKGINDSYGHNEGDAAIRALGDMLCGVFRSDDVIARLGGDEFIVFARNAGESFEETVRQRVAAALAEINSTAGKPYLLSASMGFARYDPSDPRTLSDLMGEADGRLYEEKRRKKESNGAGGSGSGTGSFSDT